MTTENEPQGRRRLLSRLDFRLGALAAGCLVAIGVLLFVTRDTGLKGLHVEGNQLVDGGKPVRLLGVNWSGTEDACSQGTSFYGGPTDQKAIAAMMKWKINTVRIPLNESCWFGMTSDFGDDEFTGKPYQEAIKGFVDRLHAAGLYVILDLHWNTIGTSAGGSPGQQDMADAARAPQFWKEVARQYKNDHKVLFDLYNEPHNVTWDCWRNGCLDIFHQNAKLAGMQDLVDAVRSTGAKQPLMLGGVTWANDLTEWWDHRPNDPANQLVASFHTYNWNSCSYPGCWIGQVAPLAQHVPVVTGEFGQHFCDTWYVNWYMNWADKNGVSYVGWAWKPTSCSGYPSLIVDYGGYPTGYGKGLKNHLAKLWGHDPTLRLAKTK
jgi:aryl-phospho-beta-D-glucosidase BglC (GH1 family)